MDHLCEVAVVLNQAHQPLYWHLPSGATAGSLPDSRRLWQVLWVHRRTLSGVAHLHPGAGPPVPSMTDLTTFAACESGLGRRLSWWVATFTDVARFLHCGPDRLAYRALVQDPPHHTHAWLGLLRARAWRIDEPA